jgi:hypothetical protein
MNTLHRISHRPDGSSHVVISILGLLAPEERALAWFGDGLGVIGLGLL